MFKKRGGIAILGDIDDLMRTGIAGQEVLQSPQLGRFRPSHQHRAAGAGFDQCHPTQYQRADNTLAKVCLGDDQRAQLGRRHKNRLQILLGIRVYQRVAAGKLSDLAGKLSSPQAHNGNHATHAVTLAERQSALQYDEHAWASFAGREQAGAALKASHGAKPADARDLRVGKHRKHLIASVRDFGRRIVGHGKFRVVDFQAIRANAPGHTMRSVATVPLKMLPTADLGQLRDPVLALPAL